MHTLKWLSSSVVSKKIKIVNAFDAVTDHTDYLSPNAKCMYVGDSDDLEVLSPQANQIKVILFRV